MFKLNKKTNYGIEFLISLAQNFDQDPVALEKIAEKKNLSHKFLEKIATRLCKQKIISSKEGRGGGYFLDKEPDRIVLADIITALEGPVRIGRCAPCSMSGNCNQKKLWQGLRDEIEKYLQKITLKDLL